MFSQLVAATVVGAALHLAPSTPHPVQFVFTSDAHYGLSRSFRGRPDVSAHEVNAALVAAINALPQTAFPRDGGLHAGEKLGSIDFVAEGGDVANRAAVVDGGAIQPAAVSRRQFVADYVDGQRVTQDGTTIDTPTLIEQRELESFLIRHPNVIAYFHGNPNWNEFYDWKSLSQHLRLHTFRVDSPMRGGVGER